MTLPEGGVRGVRYASVFSNTKPVLGRALCLGKGASGCWGWERLRRKQGQRNVAEGVGGMSARQKRSAWGMKKGLRIFVRKPLILLVAGAGFEPAIFGL